MMRRWSLRLLIVLLLSYLATSLYQVRPGERAVVRRFGRVLADARGPGLHIGLPWGLDQVDRVAVDEQRQLTVGYVPLDDPKADALAIGQVLTGDGHLVNVRLSVFYRVQENRVADYVLHRDRLEHLLSRAAEEALVVVLARQRVDAVLLGQAKDLEADLGAYLATRLRSHQVGVAVRSVNVNYVAVPPQLEQAFLDVTRARTQREIAEREAVNAKSVVVSVARQDARRQHSETAAAAHDRLARARAEATAFLALRGSLPTDPAQASNAVLHLYLAQMQDILSRFQVRTLSDKGVDQTVILPGAK
jgi:membrane protease subunit HflK